MLPIRMAFDLSGTKTTIRIETGNIYDIYNLVFQPTRKSIFSICMENKTECEIQLVATMKDIYISYVRDTSNQSIQAIHVLASFLHHPFFDSKYTYTNWKITILNSVPHTAPLPILFRAGENIYRANLKQQHYGFFVKIGGETFSGCMEIFINKYAPSTIAQIYSEPECSFDSEMIKGSIVHMIKGALQLCQTLFDTHVFEFTDNSNIDCAPKDVHRSSLPPPRKVKRPFSLAHLYILEFGKTWYESHFNACIKDSTEYEKYRNGVKNLENPISESFEIFSRTYFLSDDQKIYLEPFYNRASSWNNFLRMVPKEKRCETMNWAPNLIDTLIRYKPTHQTWVIDLGNPYVPVRSSDTPMIRTSLILLPNGYKQYGGSRNKTRSLLKRHRKTYRASHANMIFSNTLPGHTFGGLEDV